MILYREDYHWLGSTYREDYHWHCNYHLWGNYFNYHQWGNYFNYGRRKNGRNGRRRRLTREQQDVGFFLIRMCGDIMMNRAATL